MMMLTIQAFVVCWALLFWMDDGSMVSAAFTTSPGRKNHRLQPKSRSYPWRSDNSPLSDNRLCRSSSRLYWFGGWNKKNNNKNDDEKDNEKDEKKDSDESFLTAFQKISENFATKSDNDSSSTATASTTTAVVEKPPIAQEVKMETAEAIESPLKAEAKTVEEDDKDPEKVAKKLRAQAERIRLEAEKMDAKLTLEKITRLERELAKAKAKESGSDVVEELQREMDALLARMRGESSSSASASSSSSTSASSSTTSSSKGGSFAAPPLELEPFSEKSFKEMKKYVESSPGFMKKMIANCVEVDFEDENDINATEVALRVEKMQRLDYSFSNRPKPTFTAEQIEARKARLSDDWWGKATLNEAVLKAGKDNETALALYALEYEYYVDDKEITDMDFDKITQNEQWLQGLIDGVNKSDVDRSIESLFPKCTRKEGQEPTSAQVQLFVSDVLPKAKFTVSQSPEKVLGGYIVRGTNKYEDGDTLVSAIDQQLSKSTLKDKLNVFYTKDFTIFAEPEENIDFDAFEADSLPPILYVTGPDVVRERQRIALSITSAFGIGTSWYLSVYPFLLNPTLMKRAEEDLALAEANMPYDLSWLTDLSLPLFISFVGIQLAHEAGHRLAAATYGMNVTFPTFVPSIITGITSAVTTFKEPPKNKEAMFDFAVAGPLLGILASVAAVVLGSELTITASPDAAAMFPALPLEILRQSTLGGGIINAILGNGALYIPDGALGTKAVASMTVPLHPVAIAGYTGLIVNALSLLPIGTTDGGRMGLSLFGRGGKLLIGNVFLFTLLFLGLMGSDLLLFYFAFCIAFQTGNEIPARNEVDAVGFSRILMAIFAYVLGLMTLIPFQ